MPSEQYKNLATSTLASSITNSSTSLTVATGTGSRFPSAGNFRLTIDSEILICTGRSGDTLTVTRGAESTTATSHSSGANVDHNLTFASLLNVAEYMNVVDTFANRPSPGIPGRVFHPTDTPWLTKCVDTGTAWKNFHHGLELVPPPTSGWTNGGSLLTVTNEKDSILLEAPTSKSFLGYAYYRTPSNSTYTVEFGLQYDVGEIFTNHYYQRVAAAWIDVTGSFWTYASQALYYLWDDSNSQFKAGCQRISMTSWGASLHNEGDDVAVLFQPFPFSSMLYFKIVYDGTNGTFYTSKDGVRWVQQFQRPQAWNFMTGTKVGVELIDGSTTARLVHYKEY